MASASLSSPLLTLTLLFYRTHHSGWMKTLDLGVSGSKVGSFFLWLGGWGGGGVGGTLRYRSQMEGLFLRSTEEGWIAASAGKAGNLGAGEDFNIMLPKDTTAGGGLMLYCARWVCTC